MRYLFLLSLLLLKVGSCDTNLATGLVDEKNVMQMGVEDAAQPELDKSIELLANTPTTIVKNEEKVSFVEEVQPNVLDGEAIKEIEIVEEVIVSLPLLAAPEPVVVDPEPVLPVVAETPYEELGLCHPKILTFLDKVEAWVSEPSTVDYDEIKDTIKNIEKAKCYSSVYDELLRLEVFMNAKRDVQTGKISARDSEFGVRVEITHGYCIYMTFNHRPNDADKHIAYTINSTKEKIAIYETDIAYRAQKAQEAKDRLELKMQRRNGYRRGRTT